MEKVNCVFNDNYDSPVTVDVKKTGQEVWYRGHQFIAALIKHVCVTLKDRSTSSFPGIMLPPDVLNGTRGETDEEIHNLEKKWWGIIDSIIHACDCLQKDDMDVTPYDKKCIEEGMLNLAQYIEYLND